MFGKKFHKLDSDKKRAILKGMVTAGINHEGQSNREFAKNNEDFQLHCSEAGVKCTKEQASRYRRNFGAAFKSYRGQ